MLNIIFAPKGGTLLGRNAFTGPSFFNLDAGLQKNVPLGEQRRLEFRFEFFNLLNRRSDLWTRNAPSASVNVDVGPPQIVGTPVGDVAAL